MLKREESGTGTPVIAADALVFGGMSSQGVEPPVAHCFLIRQYSARRVCNSDQSARLFVAYCSGWKDGPQPEQRISIGGRAWVSGDFRTLTFAPDR
jgi:hypothetical protein